MCNLLKFLRNSSFRKKIISISTVILQIICFSQICSFVQAHHTHSADALQVIVNVHPINHHSENNNEHPSNDHEHCEWKYCGVDRTFIRSAPRVATELPTMFYATASLAINKPDLSCIIQNFYSDLSQQKVFFSSVSPRSPPHLS